MKKMSGFCGRACVSRRSFERLHNSRFQFPWLFSKELLRFNQRHEGFASKSSSKKNSSKYHLSEVPRVEPTSIPPGLYEYR